MASQSPFESLSTELFESILSCIEEPRDTSNLCLVSRAIYQRAVPNLYQSWSYHGLKHSSKSLRNFLQTIIWRSDLASHVRVLDIREWGNCPRLEDQQECPWRRTDNREEEQRDEAREWKIFDYDEGADEDYEDSDAQSYGSDASEEASDSDAEDVPEDDLGSLVADQKEDIFKIIQSYSNINRSKKELRDLWEKMIEYTETLTPEVSQILQMAAVDAGLDPDLLLTYHASVHTKKRDEDVLVARLLANLPNLRDLFMVFPEPGWTDEENSVKRMLEDSFANKDNIVLHNLETLHICSALHIGPKGHREYELEFECILPFLRLKNLRSVYTLTSRTHNDPYNTPPVNFEPYTGRSSITSLVLDEAELIPADAIKTLSVPNALENLRWSQELSCFSIGSCWTSFHTSIGNALRVHKNTLKYLDLDIRHRYCKQQGHAANPDASPDFPLPFYIHNPERSIRPPRDAVLISSLKEFVALKTLSLDATALCGHQKWVPAPMQMVDVLPPVLETLNLRVVLLRPNEAPPSQFSNTLWMAHLTDLVQKAEVNLPSLKTIGILIHGRDWSEAEDDFLFKEITEECLKAGLKLKIEDEPFGTKEPYFKEQTKNWYPGRDRWRQRKPMRYIQ